MKSRIFVFMVEFLTRRKLVKLIFWLLGIVLFTGSSFWMYRAAQVVRAELREFQPTPYNRTDQGRVLLERARKEMREIGWALADGSRQVAWYEAPRNGIVVTFVHGSPGNGLSMYRGEADALSERGYGILLIDLPGYGLSEGERMWGDNFIESVRRGIDFVLADSEGGPPRVVVFGYSMGGYIGARVAAEDGRVSALILLATYTTLSDHLHAAFRRRTPFLGYVAIRAARYAGLDVERFDTLSTLKQMTPIPMLVVWGGQDHAIPAHMGPSLKSAVAGARGIMYPDMGHLDYVGRLGDAYVDSLDAFLLEELGAENSGVPGVKGGDAG